MGLAGCGRFASQGGSRDAASSAVASSQQVMGSAGSAASGAAGDGSESDATSHAAGYTVREIDVTNDGQKIYGEAYVPDDAAAGNRVPLVIFSHELGGSHGSWTLFAQMLAGRGYAAYVFDYRSGTAGGNKSDAIDPQSGANVGMSVMTEASDLDAVIRAAQGWDFVDAGSIVLVGASQGGMVAAVEAAAHPDVAKAMILLCPAFNIVDEVHARFASEADVPQTADLMNGWMTVGRNYATDVWDYDVYGTIGAYAGPVLIGHGTADTTVDISYSQRAAQTYPKAEFHAIDGAGHSFAGSDFVTVAGYVQDFLARNAPVGK